MHAVNEAIEGMQMGAYNSLSVKTFDFVIAWLRINQSLNYFQSTSACDVIFCLCE